MSFLQSWSVSSYRLNKSISTQSLFWLADPGRLGHQRGGSGVPQNLRRVRDNLLRGDLLALASWSVRVYKLGEYL